MWKAFQIAALGFCFVAAGVHAQTAPAPAPTPDTNKPAPAAAGPAQAIPVKPQEAPVDVAIPPSNFNQLADAGLLAMREHADSMKVSGVAVISYFEGDHIESVDLEDDGRRAHER